MTSLTMHVAPASEKTGAGANRVSALVNILNKRAAPIRRALAILGLAVVLSGLFQIPARGQVFAGESEQEIIGEGWRGFTDLEFLLTAFLAMVLAAALGAVIAYHPKSRQTLDSREEAEAPKTCLMYAVVGAIIGILVLKYGVVMGFVVFGIGGLMRFRTDVGSATNTGRVMFVTLVGLACGLNLPHVAVLATAFGFVLIFALDSRIVYHIEIKDVQKERLAESAAAYRQTLEAADCHVLHEKKNFQKSQITFVFRTSDRAGPDGLENAFATEVPDDLKGVIDWEVD